MQIKYSRKIYTVEEAFDELELIFSDKQIELINVTNTDLIFHIKIPCRTSWYVDPDIEELSQNELKQLPEFYLLKESKHKIFLKTYFHYNALIAADRYEKVSGNKIGCIIHFDDHSDMMPIYKKREESFTYKEKIRNGELAIGNFITNYLIKNCIDIYHIQNSLSLGFCEDRFNYSIRENEVTIGDTEFEKIEIQKTKLLSNTYYRMDLNSFNNTEIEYENIWLDIDLDYFCNRFNRNSDWKEIKYFDKTLDELKLDIEIFLENIINWDWVKKVKVLTVASSPGFFPIEYMDYIETNLIIELQKVMGFGSI